MLYSRGWQVPLRQGRARRGAAREGRPSALGGEALVDVVVIGAGTAGASAARCPAAEGLVVTLGPDATDVNAPYRPVLDRSIVLAGETVA